MLYVLCRIGRDAYAIPSEIVTRVLPYATLKALPGAPVGLAGILNYQGMAVPVVDLSLALAGVAAREVLSTRILLCSSEETASRSIGLLLEEVSSTANLEAKDFQAAGARGATCLDEVSPSAEGLIQRIDVPGIFPPGVLASLGLSAEFGAV